MEDRVCEPAEATYSLGAVTRLTGLSAHVLRAWERRYRAVEPLRTAGGTRRYRESDVARLRLLRAATDAGHPIGDIAGLPNRELERRLAVAEEPPAPPLTAFLEAAEELDAGELERLLSVQLATLGPRGFTRLVALPLLREIGERWAAGKLGIASEHLASGTLRNLLGPALRPTGAARHAPPILFTTLSGELHELGALMAALAAADAGGHAVFLGPDLPVQEITRATRSLGAVAVAVGLCQQPTSKMEAAVHELRAALPRHVELWVGGAGAERVDLPSGALRVDSDEEVEQRVELLAARRRAEPA